MSTMENGTREIELRAQSTELSIEDIKGQVHLIQQVMADVMQEGQHFGVIGGTSKPTLLKAGAEKLGLTFRLAPSFDIETIDLGSGHREVRVLCELRHIVTDSLVGSGVGSCSTLESKYRWRKERNFEDTGRAVSKRYWSCDRDDKAGRQKILVEEFGELPSGSSYTIGKNDDGQYTVRINQGGSSRVENPDIADVYNTVLKMAKKRAHVDAMLTATAASDIFTQDLDEFAPADGDKKESAAAVPASNPAEAALANLLHMTAMAYNAKELTAKQFADAAGGVDAFLAKHPDAGVLEYVEAVRSKLNKKRNGKDKAAADTGESASDPAQPLAKTDDGEKTGSTSSAEAPHEKVIEKLANGEVTPPPGVTIGMPPEDGKVIDDVKGKTEMFDTISGMKGKVEDVAPEPDQPELSVPSPEEDEGLF